MNSRIGLTLCVALATAAAGILMNADEACAQSYGNGYSSQSQAPQKKKVGLLYRIFSRKQSQPAAPAAAPYQPPQSQQLSQPKQSRYTGGTRRSKVQELLEAKFRAEGREVPPLTLEQLAAEQGMSEPQFVTPPQMQQPYQQQYQTPQQPQQTYATGQTAAGHQNYGRPQQPAAAPAYAPAPQKIAAPTPQKKRGGFRAFISRLNPFHHRHHEEEHPAALPPTSPRRFQAAPGQFPSQQQYAQQPRRGYQAPKRYPTQQQMTPRVVTAPPSYRRPEFAQPSQEVPTVIPRPFPGVPKVAAHEETEADEFENENEYVFEEELPTLAETPSAEETVASQDDIDPFAEDALPKLTDAEIAADSAPADDEGFRPTQQPEFQEPIVKAEEVQVAEGESTSPYTGKTLDGDEPDLPKLQPVPTRNNYFNMDQLNAQVDSEALRREKRRLLLLSRPELSGLKGFCPVTLKNDRDLVDAKPEFQVKYESKVYQLSSAEAKAEFERAPDEYAPAKGGIDTVKYALGAGEVEGTLEFAAWYRGRLYLFSSAVTYDAFMRQPNKFADKPETADEPQVEQEPQVEHEVQVEQESQAEQE